MANLRRRSHEGNPSAVEHVGVAGDLQGQIEMLLDDHHRNFLCQHDKAFGDFFDYTDPNALRRLIEQEQPRIGQQSPADCQHLSLAA